MSQRDLEFEWDPAKATWNYRKHGVRFEEAATVFDDPYARIIDDPDHGPSENREIIIGHSHRNRLLFVSFVERAIALVRIISARKATRNERGMYEEKD